MTNERADNSQDDAKDQRSGLRTDSGSSMTEMGGRPHHTNANTGTKPDEVDGRWQTGLRTPPGSNQTDAAGRERPMNGNIRGNFSRADINERSVTAHNTGDQFRDEDNDTNIDVRDRKAS